MLDLQKLSLAINNTFEVLPAPGLLLLSDDGNKKNLITIGWLQFGNLWGKWTVNVFIRQSRHSFKILNNSEYFSLNILEPQKYNNQITLCAQKSGQTYDKIKESGLTIIENEKIVDLLTRVNIFKSKTELRTLIQQGGLSVGGKKVTDENAYVSQIIHKTKLLSIWYWDV